MRARLVLLVSLATILSGCNQRLTDQEILERAAAIKNASPPTIAYPTTSYNYKGQAWNRYGCLYDIYWVETVGEKVPVPVMHAQSGDVPAGPVCDATKATIR